MEFGVNLDQTAINLWHAMTWNFHEKQCQICYRVEFKIELHVFDLEFTGFHNFNTWFLILIQFQYILAHLHTPMH